MYNTSTYIYIYIYTHRWSSVPWSVYPQRYGTCGDLWVRGGMVVSWWWLVAVAVAVYKRTRDHMIYMCQYMYARRARIPLRSWVIVRLSWGTTHGTTDGSVKKWELQTTEGTSSKNKGLISNTITTDYPGWFFFQAQNATLKKASHILHFRNGRCLQEVEILRKLMGAAHSDFSAEVAHE